MLLMHMGNNRNHKVMHANGIFLWFYWQYIFIDRFNMPSTNKNNINCLAHQGWKAPRLPSNWVLLTVKIVVQYTLQHITNLREVLLCHQKKNNNNKKTT